MNLEHQLELNCKKIHDQYACFASSILKYVMKKRVGFKELRHFIFNLPASPNRDKLRKADDIYDIFDLTNECASFLHYEIYQSIRDEFCSDWKDFPELNYPVHFRAFIEKHTIDELFKTIPNLKEKHDRMAYKELTFKFGNIHVSDKVVKLDELRKIVAKVLERHPSEIELINVEKGCVIVTFLILTSVAAEIFGPDGRLSASQVKEFEELSVLWLRCGDFEVDFTVNKPQISDSGDSMYTCGKGIEIDTCIQDTISTGMAEMKLRTHLLVITCFCIQGRFYFVLNSEAVLFCIQGQF